MTNWQPSATIDTLRDRAKIIQFIRHFFLQRGVLEVDTPLMCHTSVTDPFIQSIPALFQAQPSSEEVRHYLQTSPEYAMKRLLAADSGAIFQICKAFRQGEVGRFHNPEFTMLEWYRPGFDHHQLMDEMDELLQGVLRMPAAERLSYAELFEKHLGVNPHTATTESLASVAKHHHFSVASEVNDRDTWLNLLMSHLIEPQIGQHQPCFVYDFPASMAALARIQPGNPPVASRFEVYIHGIELANGFHELQDVKEQRRRFENNNVERSKLGLTTLTIDEYFLSALDHGLPDCAGVALGIDRLIMIATRCDNIAGVLSFDFSRA